jgi:hypothetical protein
MSSLASTVALEEEPEFQPSLGREIPPPVDPPHLRVDRATVDVPGWLIRELKADYGRGATTDEGRPLGDRPEVMAWLESLDRRGTTRARSRDVR